MHRLETRLRELDGCLLIKLNLRLTHFPYALSQVDPRALQANSIMRNHGQLVGIKLARVVNVMASSLYLHSKLFLRACACPSSPDTLVEMNSNPLKIFKNQVNYTTKLGRHLYYETPLEGEIHC
jgi:hypothetical protein